MEAKENKPLLPAFSLFLSGAVLGAVAAILMAPDSGKETRRKASQWLKDKTAKRREALTEKKEQVLGALQAGQRAYREMEEAKKDRVARV